MVVDIRGTEIQIASVTGEIVVTRWVPVSSLGRAVRVETAVSHTPGGPPDPMLFALPGFPVESMTTPWVHIVASSPLAFDGYVPNSVTATIFDAIPEHPERPTSMAFSVRTDPRDDAPVRGTIHSGARVHVTGTAPEPWLAVTSSGPFARMTGFIKPSPPPPLPRTSAFDFSGDFIEGTPVEWLPVGTCLRDAPNGTIVGAIVGTLWTKPKPLPRGGTAVTVSTPWGDVTYYARESITEPPDVDWL